MKCELITAKLKDGSYKTLYAGENRAEARQVYRANSNRDEMAEKGILAIWQHSTAISRTISKAGHAARNAGKVEIPSKVTVKGSEKKEEAPKTKKRVRKPKTEE